MNIFRIGIYIHMLPDRARGETLLVEEEGEEGRCECRLLSVQWLAVTVCVLFVVCPLAPGSGPCGRLCLISS